MSEFLSGFKSDLLKGTTWRDILESGEPIDRPTLEAFLSQANDFLTQEPGPNLERRRELSREWLGQWILTLKYSRKDQRPALLLPLEYVRRYAEAEVPAGVLFAGGLEGHRGHCQAVDWMFSFVRPIILFEQDTYLTSKKRKAPFLPLGVRLSMWSYYNPSLIISVIPEKDPKDPENQHYRAIFNSTQADYCFATEGDPNQEEKRARGKPARFTLIPFIETETTTLRVQKLLPDDESDIFQLLRNIQKS